ncbi:hypothetical protein [Ornithobacterium rhinotracheale]|uniref:DUF4834 domain-containing protein n=1 Tax=Ornithobacterium rhinotracheale (strain ATCC 51463 / DSM 15997 / CCUG 23171 / CIP 104009 / LMG 9086) TaxID=867902 RepID=I3ZXV1_ORNRL|nr:hypothetical protein [Ornithobacterium rhinotracheale]AFL96535.1 hypothetical protein Ornrh_0317 [Ornithobacterium rhinotracheale DSM 15997]AIQ00293.1 hypothetical protein Q785_01720 [Ornithobacterium rhinotracheale ORT-UMN 88]KGB67856.1 hypothetical protein Q787_01690 [Ornithobacterium rhinotracheale H06-030791]MCK0200631.1 hypothetical protein [Ornithobacterium rhinotracheale]UOH64896.1 hypothetical protein MT999_06680 [Ornithobacterium rhinotracheale]
MTPILKLVLLGVILYFIYDYYRKTIKKSSSRRRNEDRDVRIFKTKEVEKSKYNVDAETVDYEEIEEDETK